MLMIKLITYHHGQNLVNKVKTGMSLSFIHCKEIQRSGNSTWKQTSASTNIYPHDSLVKRRKVVKSEKYKIVTFKSMETASQNLSWDIAYLLMDIISWIPRPVAMNFVVTIGIVVIVGDCVQWEQIMSILSWVTIVVNHGWHHHYSYIMFYIQYNSYSVFITFIYLSKCLVVMS